MTLDKYIEAYLGVIDHKPIHGRVFNMDEWDVPLVPSHTKGVQPN